MTVEADIKSAFTEAGSQVKGVKTRLSALEVTAAHNVVGTMKGVFVSSGGPVPVGTPAWALVVGEA